jgi:Right handed beta helix region
MRKQVVFSASAFVILLTLCLFPGSAHAANVTVGCVGGSGTYSTIAAALAAIGQTGPSTITITGTCTENVSLSSARSLTFIAGTGGAKIAAPTGKDVFDISVSQNIILQNLEIYGSTGFGVLIAEDSDAHINSCNIHNNAGGGVYVRQNSTLFLLSTTIQDNTPGDGLDVAANSLASTAGNTTIQDNGCAGSSVTLCSGTVAGGVGVFVGFNSFVSFSGIRQFRTIKTSES